MQLTQPPLLWAYTHKPLHLDCPTFATDAVAHYLQVSEQIYHQFRTVKIYEIWMYPGAFLTHHCFPCGLWHHGLWNSFLANCQLVHELLGYSLDADNVHHTKHTNTLAHRPAGWALWSAGPWATPAPMANTCPAPGQTCSFWAAAGWAVSHSSWTYVEIGTSSHLITIIPGWLNKSFSSFSGN